MNAFPDEPDVSKSGLSEHGASESDASEARASEPAVSAATRPPTDGPPLSAAAMAAPALNPSSGPALGLIGNAVEPRDPAWSGLDVVRLVVLSIVALIVGVVTVLLVAHFWIYPRSSPVDLARIPLVVVAGQGIAYVLLLGYMYVLVTRERGRPDFLAAIHWNWPRNVVPYVLGGVTLSIALQALAHLLPMPKNLPIDTFFRTPAEAWVISIFGMTLAPLMEELFFRGFLYPVLERGIGFTPAIFVTALAFALLHGSQLMFSWGPVLVIFLVGVVLTMVRAYRNSVAAGLIIHMAYNGTIAVLMFAATDGFRHLEKLNP